MNRRSDHVGGRRDDRAGFQRAALGIIPNLPKAAKEEQPIAHGDAVRGLSVSQRIVGAEP